MTAQLAPVRVSEAAWASCSVPDCGAEWLGGTEVAGKASDHHNRTGHRVVVVTTVTDAYEAGT